MPRTNADDPLCITDPEPIAAAPGNDVPTDVAATSSVVAGRHPVLTRAAAAVLALAVGTMASYLKYLDAEQPRAIARAGPPPTAAPSAKAEANTPVELTLVAAKPHDNPFLNVVLDVVFTDPVGAKRKVPAFWSGKDQWKVRYASPVVGVHRWRSTCSAADDSGLHGIEGQVEITPHTGTNPLYKHGPLRVTKDHRHFEHSDGTAFLWLGDTWWKNLCKRMSWEGFQELTADRKAKGFNVVQIVCGSYPDEGQMEARYLISASNSR